MSPLDLDAIQSIIDSASPAPWQASLNASDAVIAPNREHSMDADELRYYGGPVVGESIQGPDQVFIVVAREALPTLLAELRAAREVIEAAHLHRDQYGPASGTAHTCRICRALAAYDKLTREVSD